MLVLFATPLAAQEQASPTVSVRTVEPRGFGYFVGDLLRREVLVTVAEPYSLESASQPSPGRINYWLDLKSVDVSQHAVHGGTQYRLSLVYQTFYVPLSPTPEALPPFTLRFSDGDKTAVAEVPPFTFVMAPLREVQPEQPEEGPVGYLRPDAVPGYVSTRKSQIQLWAGLAIMLIALGLLAYHQAWWPFRGRPARPFTRAARALGRLSHAPDMEAYRTGLLDLHRAFDASAGRRLLAEDVPDFLAAHDEYRPLAGEITQFFESSRRAFFGNDVAGAAAAMPLRKVASLGAELSAAERRVA